MKKIIFSFAASVLVSSAHAQLNEPSKDVDWQEDSTEIVTVQTIINEQEEVTTRKMHENHFRDVWLRRSYRNLSFTTAKLTPDAPITTEMGNQIAEMKSKWGISLQSGRSYRLHLKPIANTVQFCFDYNWIELGVNYFSSEGSGPQLYNSSKKMADDKYFMPWNLTKYEASFGMAVGPSVNVCPFNYLDIPLLHYVQLHFYYHLGYHVSGLLMVNDEDADVNQATGNNKEGNDHKQMKDNLKAELGHGITNSFGFSISWKGIGIGYELRSASLKYKALSPSDFGSGSNKFSTKLSRVFVQFRM